MVHHADENVPGQYAQAYLGCILTSEVGTFCGLLNVSPAILIHEGCHFVSRLML